MVEKILAEKAVIGSTCVPASDGSDLLMYSTFEGKVFLRSTDHFRSVKETWFVPIGTITANANLLRLKDGRLLMPVKLQSPSRRVAELGGADFAAVFSDDDGRTFSEAVRITPPGGCYYLMNQRILRTHSGRVLIPFCQVPSRLLEAALETVGWAGCFYTDDEGQTWSEGKWLPGESVDQLAEPMVFQGKDKKLHMYMRTGMGFLYYSVSEDDGYSWSAEKPSPLRSPCAPFCIRYDDYEDRFIAVWDNSFPGKVHQHPRSPICLAESRDGETWRQICELDASPDHGYGYPMIVGFRDEIMITYYESPTRTFDSRNHRLKMKLLARDEAR